MAQSIHNERNLGKNRSLLWGMIGGMAFCAAMMAVMMVGGHRLMGRMCAKMKGMMEMCGDTEDPIEILRRRYAAGEISEKEFLRMKGELGE